MPDQVDRRNQLARERAAAAGRDTYRHEFVEDWPGCTTCGVILRWTSVRRCPGVVWRSSSMLGWVKEAATERETPDV